MPAGEPVFLPVLAQAARRWHLAAACHMLHTGMLQVHNGSGEWSLAARLPFTLPQAAPAAATCQGQSLMRRGKGSS